MSGRIMEAVRSIAVTPTLLVALDFDGTVSHLSDEPMAVRALPEAKAVIDRLARLDDTYVAYVSGRQLRDLVVITERPPVSPILLAGSHGAEYLLPAVLDDAADDAAKPPAETPDLLAAVRAAVDDLAGVRIEEKTYGFGLHTRLADEDATRTAQQRVDAILRAHPDWRRRSGHDVIEYSWRHEGKDDAVARLRALTGATAVLFAGDDVTDEDALASLSDDDLGIRVGPGETTANLRVADPQELAAALGVIAAIRGARGQ